MGRVVSVCQIAMLPADRWFSLRIQPLISKRHSRSLLPPYASLRIIDLIMKDYSSYIIRSMLRPVSQG